VVLWPLALGHARLWKIKRQSTQWNLEVLTQAIGELQLPAWKARRVVVLRSHTENAPMTWGFGRPVILLPDEAEGWQPDRLRAVLLHELAHIHRGDYLAQILGRLACAVYWFHPLVWIAARRLRVEGEHACDDLVLQCDSRPSDYASHLLAIARGRRVSSGLSTASVPMARISQLEGRLRAILDHSRNRRIVTRREVRLFGLFIAISLLSLSAVRPGPRIALGQTSPTQAIARETQDVPTMQVTGQVRDGKGQPIANAGVVILGRRNEVDPIV